ncbi:MAG: cobalamin-dependent protein [Anaerolineales bacterium]|nr:cobalamin-dependent protein [Anaerolineales bacterium]
MAEALRPSRAGSISELSDSPKYNIKTVCLQTGIRPVTLRAWERRYKLLNPHRTRSNYRLYSDRDLAILRWLKSRVDSGLPISAAATELAEMRRLGTWPEPPPALPITPPLRRESAAPIQYADRLFKALTAHSESEANAIFNELYALYDIATVCTDVILPCLVSIGDAWQRGEIRITTEHFASNYLRGRLMALYQVQPTIRNAARILVGCAPYELHDIGSLMLALFLRREGYRVEFLGQDVHVDDLLEYARLERPALICLSATLEQSARELKRVHAGLANMRPRPKFGFGGPIFVMRPSLRDSTPGIYLGDTLPEASLKVRQLLST